ncbi:MAG: TolC family protein, partial [Candidatus Latescibacterota bacterium]
AECIDRALCQNLDLKSFRFDLQSSRLSVVQAESNFDPALTLKLTRGQSSSPNFTSYIPVNKIEQKSTNINFTLGKSVFTGAKWGVGAYSALSESNIEREKNYSSYVGFNVTQPLLRGFGKKVNYSNIYLAHLSGAASMHTVESSAISLLGDVERAYWNLVYVREVLSARQMSLAQAESLLVYNQKGLELGILTESDVLEAKSAFFSRKQEVLEQQNSIRVAEESIKLLLNFTNGDERNIQIIPSDKPPLPSVDLDLDAAIESALSSRPDYLTVMNTLEQNKIQLDVAKNAILPDLDLNALYRLNGSGTTVYKNFRDMSDVNTYGWEFSLNLAYPLGNRSAKTDFEKRMIEFKKSRLYQENLKNKIINTIKTSIGSIEINKERIEVAKMAVEMNELKLRKEEELFRNQLSTSYLVLQYQTDLVNSRNLYNKALMDYTLSILDLRQARGTLLKELDITIITEAPDGAYK